MKQYVPENVGRPSSCENCFAMGADPGNTPEEDEAKNFITKPSSANSSESGTTNVDQRRYHQSSRIDPSLRCDGSPARAQHQKSTQ
jgi:hypothetical protein